MGANSATRIIRREQDERNDKRRGVKSKSEASLEVHELLSSYRRLRRRIPGRAGVAVVETCRRKGREVLTREDWKTVGIQDIKLRYGKGSRPCAQDDFSPKVLLPSGGRCSSSANTWQANLQIIGDMAFAFPVR